MTRMILCVIVMGLLWPIGAAHAASMTPSSQSLSLPIVRVVSPGGITGWLVQDPQLPIFSMTFLFKGSGAVNDGPDQQGLSSWLASTLDEGAGDTDALTFQQILSDRAISLAFSADRDDLRGHVRTLTRHRDTALGLLRAALTDPRFEEAAIERMRQKLLAQIQSNRSDPEWQSLRIAYDRSFGSHPYGLNSGGTLATLRRLARDDLKTAFDTRVVRARLFVAATGDVTPDVFGAILDDVFGTLPQGETTAPAQAPVQNAGNSFVLRQATPQSALTYLFPWVGYGDPARPAADMLAHILVGGFGSRLVDDLRETRGLTYGISGSPLDLDGRTSFLIMTAVPNDRVAEARAAINDHLNAIATTGVTADELNSARDYLTGSLPLGLTSTMRIADTMLDLQRYGHPPDYLDRYAQKLREITAADIKNLAQKYMTPERGMLAIVGQPTEPQDAHVLSTLPNVETVNAQ